MLTTKIGIKCKIVWRPSCVRVEFDGYFATSGGYKVAMGYLEEQWGVENLREWRIDPAGGRMFMLPQRAFTRSVVPAVPTIVQDITAAVLKACGAQVQLLFEYDVDTTA